MIFRNRRLSVLRLNAVPEGQPESGSSLQDIFAAWAGNEKKLLRDQQKAAAEFSFESGGKDVGVRWGVS